MSQPLYALADVRQQYDGRQVLRIDRLTVARGEILAVIGPSGAGKSTLLRLLNFLEPPAAGEICYENRPVSWPPPLSLRRQVTTVFQRPGLLSRSVAGNIAYGLSLRGQKLPQAEQDRWLERLGLQHLARQHARRLSAGEAQRVALARALVMQPRVLLLDEPTANLDPYNVGLIETIVREENAARGITVVLVTHNIFQARRVAHRTALLLRREVVEVAETSAFFARPTQAQTAAFLRGDLVY